MTYHCRFVYREKGRAAAIPCTRDAVILWRDKDQVGHGFCVDHLRDGHVEAIRQGWTVAESALEGAA